MSKIKVGPGPQGLHANDHDGTRTSRGLEVGTSAVQGASPLQQCRRAKKSSRSAGLLCRTPEFLRKIRGRSESFAQLEISVLAPETLATDIGTRSSS